MSEPTTLRGALWAALKNFLVRNFVDPVRGGRLRNISWPRGLGPIVLFGLVAEGVGIVLVLFAGPLRELFALTTHGATDALLFPRALLWVIAALLGMALSMGAAGALHAPAWLRWLLIGAISLVLVVVAFNDTSEVVVARVFALVAAAALLVFTAVRGGRRHGFAWWEFVVVVVLVWGSVIVSLGLIGSSSRSFGVDASILAVGFAITMLSQLAVPAAVAAGSSVAELAVSTSTWAVTAIRDNLGRAALIVVLVPLVIWRLVDLVVFAQDEVADPARLVTNIAWAVGFLAAIGGSWWAVARIRGSGERPSTSGLLEGISGVALPIAAFSVLSLLAVSTLLVLQMLFFSAGAPAPLVGFLGTITDLISGYVIIDGTRILVGLVVIVLGVVLARRGRTLMPELLVAIGISFASFGVADLAGVGMMGVADTLGAVSSAAALAVLVVVAVRRQVTLGRLTAVAVALLMGAMFAHRDFVADPLAALFGGGAFAVVLVGLVWGQLTGYQNANGDSEGYPRPTRVLLALGNSVFAISMIAFTALARDDTTGFDAGDMAWVGSIGFGNALIAGSLFIALGAAVRDRTLE